MHAIEPTQEPSTSPTGARLLHRATLVLNRSWLPVHVTTVYRALCLVFREAARVVDPESLSTHSFAEWVAQPVRLGQPILHSPQFCFLAPEVVVLTRYDRVPTHEAPFTRRNLFLRDDFTCQYCGSRATGDRITVDHVVPRSRGGLTNWENCVLACVGCNSQKADRTLKESGLRLMRAPMRPRWTPYLNLRPNQRMQSWHRFAPEQVRRASAF